MAKYHIDGEVLAAVDPEHWLQVIFGSPLGPVPRFVLDRNGNLQVKISHPRNNLPRRYKVVPNKEPVHFEVFGFSILPLVIGATPFLIPVMIAPWVFPAKAFQNITDKDVDPYSPQNKPYLLNRYVDGIIHIDTLKQADLQPEFTEGGSLHGRLCLYNRLPTLNFSVILNFDSSPSSVALVIEICSYFYHPSLEVEDDSLPTLSKSDTDGYPVTSVRCGDSIHTTVHKPASTDAYDSRTGPLYKASLEGLLRAMKMVWEMKHRHGYPHNDAIVYIDSMSLVRRSRSWAAEAGFPGANPTGRYDSKFKNRNLSKAGAECLHHLKMARREGLTYHFRLVREDQECDIENIIQRSEGIKKATSEDTHSSVEIFETVGEDIERVVIADVPEYKENINNALNPKPIDKLRPPGCEVRRTVQAEEVAKLLPRGFLAKPADPREDRSKENRGQAVLTGPEPGIADSVEQEILEFLQRGRDYLVRAEEESNGSRSPSKRGRRERVEPPGSPVKKQRQ
ncbi:hypothetical protein ABW19_dt0205540 [Dactylella cylindrospora]|nr:hypothetical protein ABW19_dt0205540 [Dactylella cylindrospora]